MGNLCHAQPCTSLQEAFKSGRKAEAKQLSDKGKQEGKLMEEANHKASDAVFKEKNTGRDDHTIDLHGLHVDEAVNRARQAIQQAKREVQPAPRPPACAELLYMLPHDGVDSPFMELIFDWSSRRRQMAVIKCLSLRCMAMCPDCHIALLSTGPMRP